jgi:hypothetical protein
VVSPHLCLAAFVPKVHVGERPILRIAAHDPVVSAELSKYLFAIFRFGPSVIGPVVEVLNARSRVSI